MIHPDFNDILITPAITSTIRSRKEINPFIVGEEGLESMFLPIMVSPMDTVIGLDNWKSFLEEKMPICFPRGIRPSDIKNRYQEPDDQMILKTFKNVIFFSYSLDEVSEMLDSLIERQKKDKTVDLEYNLLIDIANGHMLHMVDLVKSLRSRTKVKIMVGNIANPETYRVLSDAGADYVRVGIGFGGGCLTAMNTAIGYSMAQLIIECNYIKEGKRNGPHKYNAGLKNGALIVADGGFREYGDVIKALGLGADLVMLGSMLNKTLESAGGSYWRGIKLSPGIAKFFWNRNFRVEKKFRGMSTKEVQREWGKEKLTTSEGVVRMRTVKYTLAGWRENFEDYLKSAMSYTNCRTLKDFIGNVKWTVISQNSFNRFNK